MGFTVKVNTRVLAGSLSKLFGLNALCSLNFEGNFAITSRKVFLDHRKISIRSLRITMTTFLTFFVLVENLSFCLNACNYIHP